MNYTKEVSELQIRKDLVLPSQINSFTLILEFLNVQQIFRLVIKL